MRLSPEEHRAVAVGMAAGHLEQVRTGRMVPRWVALVPGQSGTSIATPEAVTRLEHLLCAARWLDLAARFTLDVLTEKAPA